MTIDVAKSVRKMFVDGKWVDSESGEYFEADSPATGEVIAQVPKGTRADAQRAVEAAHRARGAMAKLKGFERSKRLHSVAEAIEKRGDELARLLTLDQGKPLKAEAVGEVAECVEYFRIAAEDLKRLEGRVLPSASPSKLVLARHYPRGVYGIITPWNWPLTMAAELIAPALAAGNTVVWTPASSTSVISVALMECIVEADLPAQLGDVGEGGVDADRALTQSLAELGHAERRARADRGLERDAVLEQRLPDRDPVVDVAHVPQEIGPVLREPRGDRVRVVRGGVVLDDVHDVDAVGLGELCLAAPDRASIDVIDA